MRSTITTTFLFLGLALAQQCQLGAGTAPASSPYWLQDMKHQGTSAFNVNPATYKVYRNVKDYGAKGDGVTDDTAVSI